MPPVDMSRVGRILIVKLSSMGDVIHALPVSAALGAAFPSVEIYWVVEKMFVPLLSGNPFLKEVIPLPKLNSRTVNDAEVRRRYMAGIHRIRALHCDISLDLQGLTKSAAVAVASGAPIRLGYHWLREAAPLLERPVPRRPESVHIVDQYLDVARYLGADTTKVTFPFEIPEEDDAAALAMLSESGLAPGAPYLAVNPASARALKQWGEAKYARLMDLCRTELDLPSVLITADRQVAGAVGAAAKQPFINLAGRTSLKQLAALLRRCAVHVCGDTGSAHLAAALGRPVVTLIGPTDPDRVGPYGQRENTLSEREVCGISCNGRRCEYEHPRCLEAITVERVLGRIRIALQESAQR